MNIYILYGGRSIEHEVSIISATAVLNALDKEKYNIYPIFITKEGQWINYGLLKKNIIDEASLVLETNLSISESMGNFIKSINMEEENLVFPVLHGNNGEDGTIQGLLELLDLPYVGNEVLSSALCMDKVTTSEVLDAHNIAQANYATIKKHTFDKNNYETIEYILNKVKLPVFVKPANAGSSVGISRAATKEELLESLKLAFVYDTRLLIQEEVKGKEVETCIIGNNEPLVSVSGELEMEDAFYDYESKYIKKAAVPVIPANINDNLKEEVKIITKEVYKLLDCRGIARIDVFVTDNGQVLVNEVNTMPGFTSISMAPMLWKATDGSSFSDLLEKLIDYALERYQEKISISKVKVTK